MSATPQNDRSFDTPFWVVLSGYIVVGLMVVFAVVVSCELLASLGLTVFDANWRPIIDGLGFGESWLLIVFIGVIVFDAMVVWLFARWSRPQC